MNAASGSVEISSLYGYHDRCKATDKDIDREEEKRVTEEGARTEVMSNLSLVVGNGFAK